MSDGYLADTGGFTYHRELNPVFQRFCLLVNGFAAPEPHHHAQHCELGFRQGISINMHAAASPARFTGCDSRSTRVAHAQALAHAANIVSADTAAPRLLDDSFAQLCTRTDLPQFDSISLHGIWSGLHASDRKHIVQFVDHHLRPGGVLCIHYDTQPGWAPYAPLRKLLALYNRYGEGTPGGESQRVQAALEFAANLFATQPVYPSQAPFVAARLGQLAQQDPADVARDYFNPYWKPTLLVDMVRTLNRARLDWACVADPLQTIQGLHPGQDAAALLASTNHPVARAQLQDFVLNSSARTDLFIRGARRLGSMEQRRLVQDTHFVLLQPPQTIAHTLGLADRPAQDTALYTTWLDYLSTSTPLTPSPKALGGLLQAMPERDYLDHMLALLMLTGMGLAAPAQKDADIRQQADRCHALNRHLLERAISSQDITTLASPVLGGGYGPVNRLEQLFLLARERIYQLTGNPGHPASWATEVASIMASQGEHLLDDHGQPLPAHAMLHQLTTQAQHFEQHRIPVLQALQIIR